MKENLSESYNAIYQDEVVELESLHFRWPRHREEVLIKLDPILELSLK